MTRAERFIQFSSFCFGQLSCLDFVLLSSAGSVDLTKLVHMHGLDSTERKLGAGAAKPYVTVTYQKFLGD